MAGLFGGGTSSGSATNQYIMSGPTPAAAQEAAQAQISAAQIAANAVTQNTNSAIDALMQQYQTSSALLTPAINTGNQAAAQMNYMLGLPAVNPGSAPIAPTAPTLAGMATPGMDVLSQEVNQYLNPVQGSNTTLDAYYGPGGLTGAAATANAAAWNPDSQGLRIQQNLSPGTYVPGMGAAAVTQLQSEDPAAYQALVAQAQQNELTTAQNTYNQQNSLYQTQLGNYNNAEANYQNYAAKGTATSADISNIINNQPGFQFQQQQGMQAIQNAASAKGMLNSGNVLESLNQFGQNLSQTYFQNYMGNLATLAQGGTSATGQASGLASNVGQQIAGQYMNQGSAVANSALAAGQATASSYLNTPANQMMIANPYQTSSSAGSSSFDAGGILSGIGSLLKL